MAGYDEFGSSLPAMLAFPRDDPADLCVDPRR